MSKPTIILVHGAWHSPTHFGPLSKALKAHGYQVRTPELPSVIEKGTKPPDDVRADAIAVRAAVQEVLDSGSNALIVPHSYGGLPTMNAVKDLDAASRKAAGHDSHVVGIAAISSFLPREGDSLCTGVDLPDGDPDIYPREGDVNWLRPEDVHKMMYGHMSTEEAAHWGALLRPMGRKQLYFSRSEHSAHKHVPIHYLFCSEDQAMFVPWQHLTIDKLRKDGGTVRVEEIVADHSPYLKQVERTSDFIRRSAGEDLPQ